MNAEQIAISAVSALVRGNVEGHLAHIADDVTFRLNENPPQQGKDNYRRILELYVQAEQVTSFSFEGSMIEADGTVVVRVKEEHQIEMKELDGKTKVLRHSMPSFYTVRGDRISKLQISALSAPNLVWRYP